MAIWSNLIPRRLPEPPIVVDLRRKFRKEGTAKIDNTMESFRKGHGQKAKNTVIFGSISKGIKRDFLLGKEAKGVSKRLGIGRLDRRLLKPNRKRATIRTRIRAAKGMGGMDLQMETIIITFAQGSEKLREVVLLNACEWCSKQHPHRRAAHAHFLRE